MTPAYFMPSGRNVVIVHVMSYWDKCLKGILSGPRLERPTVFSSLSHLLIIMEELMDRENYPQRGEEPRAFSRTETQPFAPGDPAGESPLATFQIKILFRQNASWQGTLIWTDRELDAQFRSVLELIRLIDSALSSPDDAE